MVITSTKNDTYKLVKSLLTKKGRDVSGLYTVEGIKSVSDAIKSGAEIKFLVKSESFNNISFDGEIVSVKDEIFDGLSDTKTPQGVLAVIEKNERKEFKKTGRYVYLDNVRDPGNLGTIIRCADATGFSVLLSPNSAEIYSPKVVRSSMGSFFNTEIYENVTYEELKESGLNIISGVLSDKTIDYKDCDYSGNIAIVIGNEANGISDEVLAFSNQFVKIPILGKAESLNAGVSAALLMYETHRQRNLK